MNDQAQSLEEIEAEKPRSNWKRNLIAGAVLIGSICLYNPVKGVFKALEGQKVDTEDVSFFVRKNLKDLFQSWSSRPVVSDYKELKDTPNRETLLYERTPTKERLSHRVWDGYALNGMSADNFVFEREYGKENWNLTWVHPDRNSGTHPFVTVIAPMINGKATYKTVSDSEGKETKVKTGTMSLPLGTTTSLTDVIALAKSQYNIDLKGYQNKTG